MKPPIEDGSSGSSESDDSSCENDQPNLEAPFVPDNSTHIETSQLSSGTVTEGEMNSPVALCHARIHHWQPGDYTLVSDTDPEIGEYALDAIAYFCCEGKFCMKFCVD